MLLDQFLVGVFFVGDRAPGIALGVEVPGTNRPHPGEFFGNFSGCGVDSGVVDDLAVIDFVLKTLLFFLRARYSSGNSPSMMILIGQIILPWVTTRPRWLGRRR